MGIGKSRTFIEAVRLRRAAQVLILCPASAVLVWKREITLWHTGATYVVVRNIADLETLADYHVITHGLMSQKNGPIPEALAIGRTYDMTAIDEAHAYNAPDTNRVRALRKVAPKLGQIVPLSGTPMRNHAGDLYTLLSICYPQCLAKAGGLPIMQQQLALDALSRAKYNQIAKSVRGTSNDLPAFNILEWALPLSMPKKKS